MPFALQPADFVTIGLLVILEGLLSADNALVMAIMVLGLPDKQRDRALRYGLVGAFAFRVVATLAAVALLRLTIVKLLGAVYLAYLVGQHFLQAGGPEQRQKPKPARAGFGLPAFWATVVRVELVNLAFSIDSILVAVAMSPKLWVVLCGGILGIIALRLVVGQLLALIQRYPTLVDAAFVIIGWVALKLTLEWAHGQQYIGWEIPKFISLGIIVLIFGASWILARRAISWSGSPSRRATADAIL